MQIDADKDKDCIDRYLSALTKEISSFPLPTTYYLLPTMYIGGGTPSILSTSQINFLISSIRKKFDFSNTSEITFECNPESVNEEKLKLLKSLEVNRLSFGTQSFYDDELKFLGRVHSVSDIFQKYNLARSVGFQNINIDLIYGLPGQKVKKWLENLKKAISLSPEHVSIYPLTIEENTDLFRRDIKTSDEVQNQMHFAARDFLEKHGFIHYEISNFARHGRASQHNLNYWRCGEYLGFGSAASSFAYGKRWKNSSDIVKYVNNPSNSKECLAAVDGEEMVSDKIFLGLRLLNEGVAIDSEIENKYREKINNLQKSGLIVREKNRMKLNRNSIYVSNRIMSEFV